MLVSSYAANSTQSHEFQIQKSKGQGIYVVPEGQCTAIQAFDIHSVHICSHSCTCISYDYYSEWISKLHISKMECVQC